MGEITLVNRATQEMFGLTREELVGSPIERLIRDRLPVIDDPQRPGHVQGPQARFAGAGRDRLGLRSDGTEFPVEVGLSTVQTDEGPIVTAMVTDISESVREVEQTRKALERLRHITEVYARILAAGSAREVAEEALHHLRVLVPHAARVTLGLADLEAEEVELFVVVLDGHTEMQVGARVPLDAIPGIDRLTRGESVSIPDLARVPDPGVAVHALLAEGIRSTATVPLMAEGGLVGAMELSALSVGAFSEDDLALAREVGAQLSIAIRQSQLRSDLEERARRLEWFHEVDRGILGSTSIQELTHVALVSLRRLMPYDRAEVSVFEEQGVLLLASDGGESGPQWLADGERSPSLGDISDLRRGEARIVVDTGVADPHSVAAAGLASSGMGSYATLPMIADELLVGVLRIASLEPGPFRDVDIQIAREMADQLAVAIRQSQLHNELEARAAELESRVRERTSELAELNAQLDEFADSVSHDLRAPLRAVGGFSQALLDDYGEVLGDQGRDYADRVVRAATRMDGLIRDLLAYSRLTRGELSLAPVDLGRVVAEALEQVRADSRDADLAGAEVMPVVVAHRPTVLRILLNLLANAVKFVDDGVRPKVRVWTEERGERVRLCVSDNGIGIDPAFQAKVFGVLERLHGVDRYPGTGIGLAIVAKGSERMGGRAGVESSLGAGSTFWIELPAADQAGG